MKTFLTSILCWLMLVGTSYGATTISALPAKGSVDNADPFIIDDVAANTTKKVLWSTIKSQIQAANLFQPLDPDLTALAAIGTALTNNLMGIPAGASAGRVPYFLSATALGTSAGLNLSTINSALGVGDITSATPWSLRFSALTLNPGDLVGRISALGTDGTGSVFPPNNYGYINFETVVTAHPTLEGKIKFQVANGGTNADVLSLGKTNYFYTPVVIVATNYNGIANFGVNSQNPSSVVEVRVTNNPAFSATFGTPIIGTDKSVTQVSIVSTNDQAAGRGAGLGLGGSITNTATADQLDSLLKMFAAIYAAKEDAGVGNTDGYFSIYTARTNALVEQVRISTNKTKWAPGMTSYMDLIDVTNLTVHGSFNIPNTGATNDIWIDARTDGIDGNGSQSSPRDGSTQVKLDAIFAAHTNGYAFHLGPGTFQTKAGGVFRFGNFRLIGSGAGLTTLQGVPWDPITNQTAVIDFQPLYGVTNRWAEIRQLTVDCNLSAITNGYMGGVLGQSDNIIIEQCVFKNIGSTNGTFESMGIGISGFTNAVIRDNVIANQSGYFAGIMLASDSTLGIPSRNAIVQGNHISGARGIGTLARSGVNLGGTLDNIIVRDNWIDNVDFGIFGDTGGWTNVLITGNMIEMSSASATAWVGIFMNSDTGSSCKADSVTVDDNSINLTENGAGIMFMDVDKTGVNFKNLVISRNRIQVMPGGSAVNTYGTRIENGTGATLRDNYYGSDIAYPVRLITSTNISTFGERLFSGSPIAAAPDMMNGGYATNSAYLHLAANDPYDATGWNGNLTVPTKDAIRDKIETITAGAGDTVYVDDTRATNPNFATNTQINMKYVGTNVITRIADGAPITNAALTTPTIVGGSISNATYITATSIAGEGGGLTAALDATNQTQFVTLKQLENSMQGGIVMYFDTTTRAAGAAAGFLLTGTVNGTNYMSRVGVPTLWTNVAATSANGTYVAAFVSTNTYSSLSSGLAVVDVYAFENSAGSGEISAELYIINSVTKAEEYEFTPAPAFQTVFAGATPTKLTFSIPVTDYSSTTNFHVAVKLKVQESGVDPTIRIVTGGSYASHLSISLPSQSFVLKNNDSVTNLFTYGVTHNGPVTNTMLVASRFMTTSSTLTNSTAGVLSSVLGDTLVDESGTGSVLFTQNGTVTNLTTKGVQHNGPVTNTMLIASRFVTTSATLTNNTDAVASSLLLASLSDETGTGVAVFNDSPVFTTKASSPLFDGGSYVGGTVTVSNALNTYGMTTWKVFTLTNELNSTNAIVDFGQGSLRGAEMTYTVTNNLFLLQTTNRPSDGYRRYANIRLVPANTNADFTLNWNTSWNRMGTNPPVPITLKSNKVYTVSIRCDGSAETGVDIGVSGDGI